MKADTLLLITTVLLLAIGCRQDSEQEHVELVNAQPTATQPQVLNRPSLDSFQRSSVALAPGNLVPVSTKNKLLMRRTADSLTVSGVVFKAGADDGLLAYRFYFKADGKHCYAYLKQEFTAPVNGIQQRKSLEAGYSLHFFKAATV